MKQHRICGFVVLVALSASSALSQDRALTLGAAVSRDIGPGESHTFTVRADVGDVVSGVFTLKGVAGKLSVIDVQNTTLRTFVAADPAPSQDLRVGFLAPAFGMYRIRITMSGTASGSYLLRMDRAAAADRSRDLDVKPRELYSSTRIKKLAEEVRARSSEAVARFWRDVSETPLVEPVTDTEEDFLVTFLWKETFPTQNVLLRWPPTTQGRAEEYYLSHLAGTDVWYKSVRVRRGSRFTYSLSPNDRAADRLITLQRDPLNPKRFPEEVDPSETILSVLELPGAPDETWFRRTPAKRGALQKEVLKSAILKSEREYFVYTPAGYARQKGPYPLVILFDGYAYIDSTWGVRALTILDNLVEAGRIRAPIVCFVDTSQFRPSDLGGFGDAFGRAVADELIPRLHETYAISAAPRDVVIGGFSTGGKTAAWLALRYPQLFGNVLSQSGAFPQALPAEPGQSSVSAEANALARMYLTASPVPVRFYLDYGLYERMSNADRPMDQLVIDEAMTVANRHFRDVLRAKGYDVTHRETATGHEDIHWRATLGDALIALLEPR